MEEVKKIGACRSCYSKNLLPITSLGEHYVTNFVVSKEEQEKVLKVPLELVLCKDCGLLQLKHTTPGYALWDTQYWYKSGINRMIREDLMDISKKAKELAKPIEKDIVVDIGCNDGTMLSFYSDQNPGLELVGFEPSKNVAREAEAKGFKIINNFFNAHDFKNMFGLKKAKIINAISMFYDLDNPNGFLRDIVEILEDGGLLIIQQNYLVKMLENNAFDNICHEHLEYYSLKALENLLKRHNLEVFDVEQCEINGGSIRTYIRKTNDPLLIQSEEAKNRVEAVREYEKNLGLETTKPYIEFAERILEIKNKIMNFLKEEKSKGKIVCGCGASTRGNTALQFMGINEENMRCIFDRNPDKWGKRTIGSFISIMSPEAVGKINPDYQLVFIWHIFKGIGDDEKEHLNRGGKFILPLPKPVLIDSNGTTFL